MNKTATNHGMYTDALTRAGVVSRSIKGMKTNNDILPPLTVLRLSRLWPHARRQGHEKGQIYRIGYYCKGCGTDVVWLVDERGAYNWTADIDFMRERFDILLWSKERSLYGKGKPKLKELTQAEKAKLSKRN